MKKRILFPIVMIVTLMFIVFLLGTISYAGTQKLNKLNYDVILNSDGSANITETWDIRISETNTLFKTFNLDSKKYGNITNVSVAEIKKDGETVEFYDTGSYAYHVQKGGFYALNRKISEFEIAWGVSIDDTQTKTYQIKYKIENAVKGYDDCSEFYWQFIGTTNGIPAKEVTGKIILPSEVSNRENLKVWAHGPLHGNIKILDNKTVSFDVEDLSANTMLEVRIVLVDNIFFQNTNKVLVNKLDSIVSEETRWADEANAEREASKRIVTVLITICIVIVLAVVLIFSFVIIRYKRELSKIDKIKAEQSIEYFRDFPDENATPAEAAFLYYFDKDTAFKNNISKIVSATILSLALKKIISFEQDQKENVYIIINKDYKEVKNVDESNIYNLLASIEEYLYRHSKSKEEKIKISMKDIENYAKKHDQAFLSKIDQIEKIVKTVQANKGNYNEETEKEAKKWKSKANVYYIMATFCLFMSTIIIPIFFLIPLIICGIFCGKIAKKTRNLTQKGANEKEEWKALKKYMEDFSLLNEREVPELVLWEKYLVYATAFGIADKVLSQLKIRYPELADESYMISRGYTYMYMVNRINFDRMIVSGITKAYNTGINQRNIRTAASSYSSRKWRGSEDFLAEVGGRTEEDGRNGRKIEIYK